MMVAVNSFTDVSTKESIFEEWKNLLLCQSDLPILLSCPLAAYLLELHTTSPRTKYGK